MTTTAQTLPCNAGCPVHQGSHKPVQALHQTAEPAIVLTEQDAVLLNQAIEQLEEFAAQQRQRGNCSSAEGAECSAHAVQRLGVAMLAVQRGAQPAPAPAPRTEPEAMARTETAARFLLGWKYGQMPTDRDTLLRQSAHAKAQWAWNAACKLLQFIDGSAPAEVPAVAAEPMGPAAPATPAADDSEVWPCVNIDVDDAGNVTSAKLYSPGLPAGNHDVYPVRVPYMDEHTEAWRACHAELWKLVPDFMRESQLNGMDSAVAAIRHLAADKATPALTVMPEPVRSALAAVPAAAPDAREIEAAAKRMAELFDYPWEQMPNAGRENMRKNARDIFSAAQAGKGDAA